MAQFQGPYDHFTDRPSVPLDFDILAKLAVCMNHGAERLLAALIRVLRKSERLGHQQLAKVLVEALAKYEAEKSRLIAVDESKYEVKVHQDGSFDRNRLVQLLTLMGVTEDLHEDVIGVFVNHREVTRLPFTVVLQHLPPEGNVTGVRRAQVGFVEVYFLDDGYLHVYIPMY